MTPTRPPGLQDDIRTGWPPGMLQDDSPELSRWLAGRVGAWSLAREAAGRITETTMELQAEWTPDCQGKQDYDADLVRLSTRYWPRGGGYAEMTKGGRWLENDARPSIPPSATATIYLQDEPLTAASFEGATEAEVKAKVEAWAREQFAKVVSAMSAAFRA